MYEPDYVYYLSTYNGTIIADEDIFKKFVVDANSYINMIVRRSANTEEEENLLKYCVCKVADLLCQDMEVRAGYSGRIIKSENTDGYSVSFSDAGSETIQARIYNTIRRYLAGTRLVYQGVGCCADKCCHYNF